MVKNEYYKGKGTTYLRKLGENTPLIAVGNASEVNLAFNTATQNMKDYENAGGGNADSITTIESVQATITVNNLNPENVARATAGRVTVMPSTAVSAEIHDVLVPGQFIKLKKMPDMSKAVTVVAGETLADHAVSTAYALNAEIKAGGQRYRVETAGTSGSTTPSWPTNGTTVTDGTVVWRHIGAWPTTFADGTEYELKNGGILILGGALAQPAKISVSYTSLESREVETLLEVGAEYEMYFDGLNEARNGKPHLITIHRCKVNPTQNMGLITEDYGSLQLTVDVLRSDSVTGSGRSKYVKIEMAS